MSSRKDKLRAQKEETAIKRMETEEEMREIEERLTKLDEDLQESEKKEEAMFADMQDTCTREIRERLARLDEQFRRNSEERMTNVVSKLSTDAQSQIATKQAEILRTNKIFRDVARALGPTNWKPLFRQLMVSAEADVLESQESELEQGKPFMRAYKALLTWKDFRGADFQIGELPRALVACNMHDLAEKAYQTMDTSEGEVLRSVSDKGKIAPAEIKLGSEGIKGKVTANTERPQTKAAADSNATGVKSSANNGGGDKGLTKPNAAEEESANGSVEMTDSHLLRLAKKIPASWVSLAKTLGISERNVKEIFDSEGDTYQGAFKMLFEWRDAFPDNANIGTMVGALYKTGQLDLAREVSKWS